MSGFQLYPEGYNDLDEIWEYVAADNLDAADRVREEIYTAIRSLVSTPHRGHRLPSLTRMPLRFIVVRDFLIAYAADDDPL